MRSHSLECCRKREILCPFDAPAVLRILLKLLQWQNWIANPLILHVDSGLWSVDSAAFLMDLIYFKIEEEHCNLNMIDSVQVWNLLRKRSVLTWTPPYLLLISLRGNIYHYTYHPSFSEHIQLHNQTSAFACICCSSLSIIQKPSCSSYVFAANCLFKWLNTNCLVGLVFVGAGYIGFVSSRFISTYSLN